MKAGLEAKVADELALGRRPSAMSDDEAAVYEFCIQLHRTRKVDDATFNRALALFGEQGVVDLIGVSAYYTAVSMTLNVAQVMPPEGAPLPLK
jgi:4-carboxymuconolactone decarboxylase